MNAKRLGYTRMETDDEFAKRLVSAGALHCELDGLITERLDDYGWMNYKMQRRIVEGS